MQTFINVFTFLQILLFFAFIAANDDENGKVGMVQYDRENFQKHLLQYAPFGENVKLDNFSKIISNPKKIPLKVLKRTKRKLMLKYAGRGRKPVDDSERGTLPWNKKFNNKKGRMSKRRKSRLFTNKKMNMNGGIPYIPVIPKMKAPMGSAALFALFPELAPPDWN